MAQNNMYNLSCDKTILLMKCSGVNTYHERLSKSKIAHSCGFHKNKNPKNYHNIGLADWRASDKCSAEKIILVNFLNKVKYLISN